MDLHQEIPDPLADASQMDACGAERQAEEAGKRPNEEKNVIRISIHAEKQNNAGYTVLPAIQSALLFWVGNQ